MDQKISGIVSDISKAVQRQVGDTKVDSKGRTKVWTEIRPGEFDWRRAKGKKAAAAKTTPSNATATKKNATKDPAKIKAVLKKTDSAKLVQYASNPKNDPNLRQFAYDELEERGEDVSGIDMNTGRYGALKKLTGASDGTVDTSDLFSDDDDSGDSSYDEDEEEWDNPDYIKKKFGGLKTKRQRIAADLFIHKMKIQSPGYVPPHEEVHDMNMTYLHWLETESPLLIVSGGAGVGKSWNFKACAAALGLKGFNPTTDQPGDGDYDFVEVGEVSSAPQLAQTLNEHNGKIILFDDTDNVLKKDDTMGIMKKATDPSGDRIVGKKSTQANSNVDPFKFTGKICFLTNMNQHDLTKNPHIEAVYSRADKKDLYFTKKEQLSFIRMLKNEFEWDGTPKLADPAENAKERQEVFDIIEANIDRIDPQKFNSRTMKEALNKKRAIESANERTAGNAAISKLVGGQKNWQDAVERILIKGSVLTEEEKIQKALDVLKFNDEE